MTQVESTLKQWMDNHRQDLPGDNKIGSQKRDVINALVGIATNLNRNSNPFSGKIGGPGSAIKQFRLDRVDTAAGTGRVGFHFDYDKANGNLLPEVATPLPDLSRDLPRPPAPAAVNPAPVSNDTSATAPLSETTPTTSTAPAAASIAPEPTGSSKLIAGEGSASYEPSAPTAFDFKRAAVYATSSGATNLKEATNGISSTLAQIRDERLAAPYQSDFQTQLFAQTEGAANNLSNATSRIEPTRPGPAEVSEQDYDRLVEEGIRGNWQSLAGAVAMRGKASSILPEFVDGKIPVWNIVGTQIESPADLAATLMPLRSPYVESIKIAVLDSNNKVVSSEVVSVGTINEGILHARELTRSLARIRKNTKQNFNKIVIAHNHPSGDPTPSTPDLKITERLDGAAQAMGFQVVDHIITNGSKFYSFRSGFDGGNTSFAGNKLTSPQIDPGATDISIPSQPAPSFTKDKAKWERVSRLDLPYMDSPEKSANLLSVLKQGDPNAGHILYLNTKLRLTAVERIPEIKSYENDSKKIMELKRRIMETASLDGAFAFIFHTPETGGSRTNLMRELDVFSKQTFLPMVDYAATDPNNPNLFYSSKASGLLMEDAPEY